MLKKIGIIVGIISIIIVCVFVYFSKNRSIEQISPASSTKTISGTTFIESWATQKESEWDPNVMRVGQPVQTQTGVTVTISTNGPAVRAMTPNELKEFQKKIQGK